MSEPMKCTNGHPLRYSDSDGTWWHEEGAPGWKDCTAPVDCLHPSTTDRASADPVAPGRSQVSEVCDICGETVRSYPLPTLI